MNKWFIGLTGCGGGSTAACIVVREVLFVSAVVGARVNFKLARAMGDETIGRYGARPNTLAK